MDFKPIISDTGKKPILIAGPCSAESEEQVLTAAHALSRYPEIDFFRASVWKPRTHPGAFEGEGVKALAWLQRTKSETGMKICTEVACAAHAEQALNAGIDMIWIGARTTVNPFLVEEIAEAVSNCAVPVMVKNPVNPDIDLWIGALERFYRKGISQLAAIHRGFSGLYKGIYRNEPFWEMVFELKRRHSNLPIITDPSHLTGDRKLVPAMCQKALSLETDGLMIEVHPSPEKALTDKNQQLTFDEFDHLMQNLFYHRNNEDRKSPTELLQIRTEIDEIDTEIIKLLAQRMKLSGRIGHIKLENQLTLLQMDRWKDVVETRLAFGDMKNVDRDFLLKILQLIHEESLRIQTEVFEK